MTLEQIASVKSFGGQQLRYKHASKVLDCDMHFSIFLPPQAQTEKVPVIYWLSGLTCTDENFVQKAGAQQYASAQGVAIITPDTSPRGEAVPDDSEASYDFGLGAGFYVNATQEPWARHYRMYDYITEELPGLLAENFSVDVEHASIMGHSMGGHGALTIALKNPGKYKSVSAFSPICSPMNCPWGEKALGNYIGDYREAWQEYDACELIKTASERLPILVDQGTSDDFMEEQLKPWLLKEACAKAGQPLELRMREGYDHSYFFIASFIEEHIKHHAQALGRN